ncbi:MAG: peptide ABC transporter permease [Actinobacteria bacterium]|nr:peptide ABC transporter permease [Actinomycetota bacterium]
MFLALNEIRRALVRFSLLAVTIGLLVFLILFQQTLQSGLITSFVGAIQHQSAPVLVYSVDGLRNLEGSVILPDVEKDIRAVDGVGVAGRIGQGTFSVHAGGKTTSAAIIGFEDPRVGAPTTLASGRMPDAEGEVVALESAADQGFGLGEMVRVEPGGTELRIVGQASEIGLHASPTLFTTYGTLEHVVAASNPQARGIAPAAIGVIPRDGVSDAQVVERIDSAVPDAEALTRADAVASTPGVAQIQQSFRLIFLLYGLVVPLVTGLFFLILTLQKAQSLTLLRAVGATAGALIWSLLIQVVVVMVVGIGLAVAMYTPLASRRLGGLPLRFQTGAVVFWAVALFVLGVLSALVSMRRVLRIEPIEATTGAGVTA